VCGRFSFAVKAGIIKETFDVEVDAALLAPRYNCAPSQKLAVITNENPEHLSLFRWGLIPSWAKDLSIGNKTINAKAETLFEKPSFRLPAQKRRCLVPADSFYEWRREIPKTPSVRWIEGVSHQHIGQCAITGSRGVARTSRMITLKLQYVHKFGDKHQQ
jgi:putative SOS response-associated peptidase YedK